MMRADRLPTAAGGDSLLFMNGTEWATRRPPAPLAVGAPAPLARAPYPNPSRGAVHVTLGLPRAMAVSVDVFDLSGRHVRALARGRFEAGALDLTWDGRLAGGEPAPVGLYLFRARMDASSQWWRVVRVR